MIILDKDVWTNSLTPSSFQVSYMLVKYGMDTNRKRQMIYQGFIVVMSWVSLRDMWYDFYEDIVSIVFRVCLCSKQQVLFGTTKVYNRCILYRLTVNIANI